MELLQQVTDGKVGKAAEYTQKYVKIWMDQLDEKTLRSLDDE